EQSPRLKLLALSLERTDGEPREAHGPLALLGLGRSQAIDALATESHLPLFRRLHLRWLPLVTDQPVLHVEDTVGEIDVRGPAEAEQLSLPQPCGDSYGEQRTVPMVDAGGNQVHDLVVGEWLDPGADLLPWIR